MIEYCIHSPILNIHEHITVSTLEDVEYLRSLNHDYKVTRIDGEEN